MSNITQYHEPIGIPDPVSDSKSWGMMLASPFVWFVPAIVFCAIVGVFSGLILIPVLYIVIPIVSFCVAFLINKILLIRKQQRALIILGYVENAVRLNLPLNEFLLAAEMSERGAMGRQLQGLRQMLQRGYPLSTALSVAIPDFPEAIAAETGAAERLGQLQPTLSRIIEENTRNKSSPRDDMAGMYRLYPVGIIILVFIMLTFYMILIIPKFQEIFKDFKTTLPPITQYVLRFSDLFFNTTPVGGIFTILICIGVFTAIGFQLQRIFVPSWPVPRFRGLLDWLSWHTPLWRGIVRNRGLAAVSRVAADGIRSGLPITNVIEQTLSLSINRHLKTALSRWRERLIAGAPLAQAAAEAGLPAILVGFLASGQTPKSSSDQASLADIFDFMARYFETRVSTTAQLIRAAFEPLAVLAVGTVVAVLVLSMFLPLVYLINSVLGSNSGGTL